MSFQRKNLASVPPVVMAGTTRLSGIMRLATRRDGGHQRRVGRRDGAAALAVGRRLDRHPVGEIAERLLDHRLDLVRFDAGQRCGCRRRSPRGRGSRSPSSRRGRCSARTSCACRRGPRAPAPGRRGRRAVSHTRSGSVSASVSRRLELERLDVAAPRVEDARLRPVLGQPLDDLGRGHERVVGAERARAVAGRAVHDQPPPVAALLADRHLQRVARLASGSARRRSR